MSRYGLFEFFASPGKLWVVAVAWTLSFDWVVVEAGFVEDLEEEDDGE